MSANRVVASGWMEGSVVVSVAGQGRSMIEGILTCVTARHKRVVVAVVVGNTHNFNLLKPSGFFTYHQV